MAQTPIRGLPYPDLQAVPDVPADILALALSLDRDADWSKGTLANRAAATTILYYVEDDPTPANNGVLWIQTTPGSWATVSTPPSPSVSSHVFSLPGGQVVRIGTMRLPFPKASTILSVMSMAGTAPTGAAHVVDVNKNGVTIFTTQGNRPSIAAGAFASVERVPNVTAVAAGQYLTVDVDAVGSIVAGSDVTVLVRYQED